MLDRADAILKLALALAALFLGGGVGYYYGVFLPMHTAREAERVHAAEQAQLDKQKEADDKKAAAVKDARTEYNDCLSFAQLGYTSRWNSTCRSLHDAEQKNYDACVSSGYSTDYCATTYPVRPAKDCSLPDDTASDYDDSLKSDKDLCLQKLRASQS
ncbi:hypothetical protein [Novosphingobium album (ex Liu et al. 2023)]|uniref:DUF3551 domain-containing protein n=1 Tax=Novosphingobium album (ex Liu et al. 2023) TaxID=3031130 RepID=A0ABT5WRV3_9SPHN|nr:hypothetical protein [Novosphingobium album (ex Liu et al. 2023)]MDE8651718.1 hypothetical protein [Novosphingobium album (ex Liu et al. 2023)]